MRVEIQRLQDGPTGAVARSPMLRASFAGGCPLPDCDCSRGYWIMASDGEQVATVYLTGAEVAQIAEAAEEREFVELV